MSSRTMLRVGRSAYEQAELGQRYSPAGCITKAQNSQLYKALMNCERDEAPQDNDQNKEISEDEKAKKAQEKADRAALKEYLQHNVSRALADAILPMFDSLGNILLATSVLVAFATEDAHHVEWDPVHKTGKVWTEQPTVPAAGWVAVTAFIIYLIRFVLMLIGLCVRPKNKPIIARAKNFSWDVLFGFLDSLVNFITLAAVMCIFFGVAPYSYTYNAAVVGGTVAYGNTMSVNAGFGLSIVAFVLLGAKALILVVRWVHDMAVQVRDEQERVQKAMESLRHQQDTPENTQARLDIKARDIKNGLIKTEDV